jgi:hypothetical protein
MGVSRVSTNSTKRFNWGQDGLADFKHEINSTFSDHSRPLLMVIAGALAYLLGMYVSAPLVDDVREIAAIAVGTTLASALAIGFLKFVIGTSARNIFPLGYLLLTCFMLGFLTSEYQSRRGLH